MVQQEHGRAGFIALLTAASRMHRAGGLAEPASAPIPVAPEKCDEAAGRSETPPVAGPTAAPA